MISPVWRLMKGRVKKLKKNKHLLALAAVLVVAVFLRFFMLGQVPASPDWDEAALGYNAYSLLKTGRDEYGVKLPLVLRSFDDYKPALYAYLAILPIKFFGLNLWAVRLPAAIFGVLAVLLTYLLVKELFSDISPRRSHGLRFATACHRPRCSLALLASLLLAVSPWHLQFSRAAFESAVGMTLNVFIALLFLKGLKKPLFLILSAFFAGLNLYAYQAEKIFTPLLVLAIAVIWRKKLFKLPRQYLAATIVVGLLVTLPFVRLILTTPEIFLRAKGTSFSSDQTVYLSRTVQKLMRDYHQGNTLGLVLDNRRVTYLYSFLSGYLSHFNLNWLFIAGDDARHHAPRMALLYLVELPFLLWGIYEMVFTKKEKQARNLVFAWLMLAPLPAAFTSGVPHAVRAMRMMPGLQILVASGLLAFWQTLKTKQNWPRVTVILILGGLTLFNFVYFLNQYFIQLNYFTSYAWQYGYERAVDEVEKIQDKYDKIVVTNQPHLDQSYMFFLYYLQYDPASYQREGGTVTGGFAEDRNAFGKYEFRPIDWSREEKNERILYVGRPDDFGVGASVHKTINFLDGTPAVAIVKGK